MICGGKSCGERGVDANTDTDAGERLNRKKPLFWLQKRYKTKATENREMLTKPIQGKLT